MTDLRYLFEECGFTAACDDHVAIGTFSKRYSRARKAELYSFLHVHTEDRHVTVRVSSAGTPAHIFVDGVEIPAVTP